MFLVIFITQEIIVSLPNKEDALEYYLDAIRLEAPGDPVGRIALVEITSDQKDFAVFIRGTYRSTIALQRPTMQIDGATCSLVRFAGDGGTTCLVREIKVDDHDITTISPARAGEIIVLVTE